MKPESAELTRKILALADKGHTARECAVILSINVDAAYAIEAQKARGLN